MKASLAQDENIRYCQLEGSLWLWWWGGCGPSQWIVHPHLRLLGLPGLLLLLLLTPEMGC